MNNEFYETIPYLVISAFVAFTLYGWMIQLIIEEHYNED